MKIRKTVEHRVILAVLCILILSKYEVSAGKYNENDE
jgi:hypothetical protein